MAPILFSRTARGANGGKKLTPGGKLSKSMRKRMRKHANVVTAQHAAAKEQALTRKEEERVRLQRRAEAGASDDETSGAPKSALSRFFSKPKP